LARSDDLLSETGEIVLVGSADLFDHAVSTQSFHQTGNLACVFAPDVMAQIFILEAADVELTSAQRLK
jgi:hypothetical protein